MHNMKPDLSRTDAIQLREAHRDDLPTIVAMLADDPLGAGREVVSNPLAEEYVTAFDEITAQPGNCVIVAVLEGSVAGCLQLTIVPGLSRMGAKRALIEGVRVSSGHRSRGIGELLMRDAIERARNAGCALVQLTTDASRPDAHRFYERLGFTASHIGFKMALHDPR
jgi:ribosomal protein S18 acetylase RimI-like enzyme